MIAFGPSLLNANRLNGTNNYQNLWLFMTAPTIGGVLAGLLYENYYMFREFTATSVPAMVYFTFNELIYYHIVFNVFE